MWDEFPPPASPLCLRRRRRRVSHARRISKVSEAAARTHSHCVFSAHRRPLFEGAAHFLWARRSPLPPHSCGLIRLCSALPRNSRAKPVLNRWNIKNGKWYQLNTYFLIYLAGNVSLFKNTCKNCKSYRKIIGIKGIHCKTVRSMLVYFQIMF